MRRSVWEVACVPAVAADVHKTWCDGHTCSMASPRVRHNIPVLLDPCGELTREIGQNDSMDGCTGWVWALDSRTAGFAGCSLGRMACGMQNVAEQRPE